jgi:hypothetical protein
MPNTTTAFNPAPLPPPWQEVVQRIYLAQAVHLAQELTYPTIRLVEQVTLPPFSERKKLPHLGALDSFRTRWSERETIQPYEF